MLKVETVKPMEVKKPKKVAVTKAKGKVTQDEASVRKLVCGNRQPKYYQTLVRSSGKESYASMGVYGEAVEIVIKESLLGQKQMLHKVLNENGNTTVISHDIQMFAETDENSYSTLVYFGPLDETCILGNKGDRIFQYTSMIWNKETQEVNVEHRTIREIPKGTSIKGLDKVFTFQSRGKTKEGLAVLVPVNLQ